MQAGIYKHYKGGYYQVLGVGAHSESDEKMVVYVSLDAALSGPRMRIRPLDGPEGFQTPVENPDRYSSAAKIPRFFHVGDQIS